jgi:hypothetical protein
METTETDWRAEYNFWHRIIAEEVERLRFNDGFEPVRVDLYPLSSPTERLAYIGKTQIGRTVFNATGRWAFDSDGKKVLRLEVLKAP